MYLLVPIRSVDVKRGTTVPHRTDSRQTDSSSSSAGVLKEGKGVEKERKEGEGRERGHQEEAMRSNWR